LKMNFNFNFKDMPFATGASMCDLTNASDLHHAEKYGIKRASQQPPGVGAMVPICRNGGEGHHAAGALLRSPLQETSRIKLELVETHQNLG